MSNARKLKGTNLNVNRVFPVEIIEARKALLSMYKEYRDPKKYNKVSRQYPAKLLVNGVIKHDMVPDWSETMSGLRVDSRQLYVNSELRQRDSSIQGLLTPIHNPVARKFLRELLQLTNHMDWQGNQLWKLLNRGAVSRGRSSGKIPTLEQ